VLVGPVHQQEIGPRPASGSQRDLTSTLNGLCATPALPQTWLVSRADFEGMPGQHRLDSSRCKLSAATERRIEHPQDVADSFETIVRSFLSHRTGTVTRDVHRGSARR